MQCDPEPVQDLDIKLSEENSTIILSWKPSTESKHVLLYELRYVPVSESSDCALNEMTMYLPAVSFLHKIKKICFFRALLVPNSYFQTNLDAKWSFI